MANHPLSTKNINNNDIMLEDLKLPHQEMDANAKRALNAVKDHQLTMPELTDPRGDSKNS